MDGLTTRHLIPSHLAPSPAQRAPSSLTLRGLRANLQFTIYVLLALRPTSSLSPPLSGLSTLSPQLFIMPLGASLPPHNESQVRRVGRRLNCYAISALLRQRPEVRGNVVRGLISGDRNQKLEAANNRGCAAFTRQRKRQAAVTIAALQDLHSASTALLPD